MVFISQNKMSFQNCASPVELDGLFTLFPPRHFPPVYDIFLPISSLS